MRTTKQANHVQIDKYTICMFIHTTVYYTYILHILHILYYIPMQRLHICVYAIEVSAFDAGGGTGEAPLHHTVVKTYVCIVYNSKVYNKNI